MKVTGTRERTVIPYGSKAGQEAFDIFYRIAQRLHAEAKAETDFYIATAYSGSETLKTEHANGGYQRTIRTRNGEEIVVRYEYRTKTIRVV